MTTFTFNGRIAATVTILGKPYTLVATTDMGQASAKIDLSYHAAFDDSIEVGTIGAICADLANLAAGAIQLGGTALNATTLADPAGPLAALLDQAKKLPGFGAILPAALKDARVRITDLVLRLDAPPDPAGGAVPAIKSGALSVGVGLDFRTPVTKLLGITLDTITLLVKFDLAVA